MSINPTQLAAIKAEITTDPLVPPRGYATMTNQQISDSFKVVDQTVPNETVSGGQIVSVITRAELAALVPADLAYVNLISGTASPLPITAVLRAELTAIFPAGSTTRPRLVQFLTRPGNRAEKLAWGVQ